jgi:hypothetical protein
VTFLCWCPGWGETEADAREIQYVRGDPREAAERFAADAYEEAPFDEADIRVKVVGGSTYDVTVIVEMDPNFRARNELRKVEP